MNQDEEATRAKALEFANKNKKQIARKHTDLAKNPSDVFPVSIFMAGSPGAGKTEVSKSIIESLGQNMSVIRIDSDDLREEFEDYTGNNSHLFQAAVSTLANNIHDRTLKNKQSFVFDGTFSNFKQAKLNIERSLKRERKIEILYVYQDPLLSWEFVKKREKIEGRRIRKEDFIHHFFESRDTVNKIKEYFGSQIRVSIIIKDIQSKDQRMEQNVTSIDNHIPEKYTKEILGEILK